MSVKIDYDQDTDPEMLAGAKLAILGYGSQGHAHALNLRDSGLDVRVGLREGSRSCARAETEGLAVRSVSEAASEADVVVMLVPDPEMGEVYPRDVAAHLRPGDLPLFAHGFAVRFGEIVPPAGVDVAMMSPKCPGHRLRELYRHGEGPSALVAVAQDATGRALARALAYAHALGCARAGVIETTFVEETETDLFGEQAVLCGGVSALVQAGFETLVEAGYQPEIAYLECLHELKLIVDLMYRGGLSAMRHSVSDTAEFGDYTAGPQIVTSETRDAMRFLLARIQSGEFAREWLTECRSGGPRLRFWRDQGEAHAIEEVGGRLRSMMPWLTEPPHPARFADRGATLPTEDASDPRVRHPEEAASGPRRRSMP